MAISVGWLGHSTGCSVVKLALILRNPRNRGNPNGRAKIVLQFLQDVMQQKCCSLTTARIRPIFNFDNAAVVVRQHLMPMCHRDLRAAMSANVHFEGE